MAPSVDEIDRRLLYIGQQPFRAKFELRGRDRATAQLRGIGTMRQHAAELIAERLAPAAPRKDGRQTPYRGHPVFVAQHATATCCRNCLHQWHDLPRGRVLSRDERAYLVDVICRWIELQLANPVSR